MCDRDVQEILYLIPKQVKTGSREQETLTGEQGAFAELMPDSRSSTSVYGAEGAMFTKQPLPAISTSKVNLLCVIAIADTTVKQQQGI